MDDLPHHAEPRLSRAAELAIHLMAGAALVFIALVLSSCGGGSGGPPYTMSESGPQRTDLLFGFYGMNANAVTSTASSVNLVWAAGFYGVGEQMAALTQAKGNGQKTVVPMELCLTPIDQMESQARFWLQRLHDAGLLDGAQGTSWCDEPNTGRSGAWSDADAMRANSAVKRAMSVFPEMQQQVWMIFQCNGDYPGAANGDRLACDSYDQGCNVFGNYDDLRRANPNAKLFVVPGGGGKWKQLPSCFLAYANTHPDVIAIVAWIYQSVTDGGNTQVGIADNGLANVYCVLGRTIIGKDSKSCQ